MGLISNGTTIFDNGTVNAGGSLKFISKATASSSASIEFTSGIDSTYKEYVFYFNNIHPATVADFQFNISTDNGSNYNVVKTSTAFLARNKEDATSPDLLYVAADDLAQSTAYQNLSDAMNVENDSNLSGYLHLYNPSSTTYVKHYISSTNFNGNSGSSLYSMNYYVAGYGNTTSAIDAIKFQMSSGNIDAGEIILFGIN